MIDRGLTTACNGQRLVVSRDSGQAMLERVTKPRRPTKAMRELFGK